MLGSKAARQNIYVKQGSDWPVHSLQFLDSAGNVVNLSGSSFVGQVRKDKDPASLSLSTFDFTITNNNTTLEIRFPKAKSLAMTTGLDDNDPASQFVYDWEWTRSDGTVDRFQEGEFILSPEVTK